MIPVGAPGELCGRSCRLVLDRPRIMGVLNVTPDSFYDGGLHAGLDQALRHAEQLVAEGADLIDVGGESTRPGAAAVSDQEETDRVLPVVEALVARFEVPLSIDTSKSRVAIAALASGAEFINDISGLKFDAEMARCVARQGAGLFLMHTPDRPERMQLQTAYADLLGEVRSSLEASLRIAEQAGVPRHKLAVDPGVGFGKDLAGNLLILRHLDRFTDLGVPLLLGTSRKSFIGRVLGQDDPNDRLAGTLASVALGVAWGAQLFRVHDVRAAREAALLAWAICTAESPGHNH